MKKCVCSRNKIASGKHGYTRNKRRKIKHMHDLSHQIKMNQIHKEHDIALPEYIIQTNMHCPMIKCEIDPTVHLKHVCRDSNGDKLPKPPHRIKSIPDPTTNDVDLGEADAASSSEQSDESTGTVRIHPDTPSDDDICLLETERKSMIARLWKSIDTSMPEINMPVTRNKLFRIGEHSADDEREESLDEFAIETM